MNALKKMSEKCLWLLVLVAIFGYVQQVSATVEIDKETGLIIAPGFEQVKQTCTVCHSPKLIIQNRADRDGWLEMIRWMQDKQGLRQLEPELEAIILEYLSNNYSPAESSRRPPLKVTFPE